MDTILVAVMKSKEKNDVEKTRLAKLIINHSSKSKSADDQCKMLIASSGLILRSDDELVVDLCQKIFSSWCADPAGSFEFFDSFTKSIWDLSCPDPAKIIWILNESLTALKNAGRIDSSMMIACHKVMRKIILQYPRFQDVVLSCRFLLGWDSSQLPVKCRLKLALAIINVASKFDLPTKNSSSRLTQLHQRFTKESDFDGFQSCSASLKTDSNIAIIIEAQSLDRTTANQESDRTGFECPTRQVIGQLLKKIACGDDNDNKISMPCLGDIFDKISNPYVPPSKVLGAVIQCLPVHELNKAILLLLTNKSITDEQLTEAIDNMVGWLHWPLIERIDDWIIVCLKGLAALNRFSILMDIGEKTIKNLFGDLKSPLTRRGPYQVICHILLSFQHDPYVFHKIVPDVPELLQILHGENTSEAMDMTKNLADLLHCLMCMHGGYPDLYEPILDAIKDQMPPTVATMTKIIDSAKWNTHEPRNLGTSVNLGNTCYVNSVLQTLYMCDSFCQEFFSVVSPTYQSTVHQMQKVFAFLSLSQRPAYTPKAFISKSRPAWFVEGAQQDCSEFMKHLLNTIHDEEAAQHRSIKSNSSDPNNRNIDDDRDKSGEHPSGDKAYNEASVISRNFEGKVLNICQCCTCLVKSSKVESFIDISLAFPDENQTFATSSQKASIAGGSPSFSDADKTETGNERTASSLSLHELLNHYFSSERLEGENKYHCGVCGNLQDGLRINKVLEYPAYLVLTLLRFTYNIKSNTRSKLLTEVTYPRVLRLPVHQVANPDGQSGSADVTSGSGHQLFGLVSVIVHSGTTSDSGHYYSYARHSHGRTSVEDPSSDDFDVFPDEWLLFNDARVSVATFDSFSQVTSKFCKDTAYVLVYRRIDDDGKPNRLKVVEDESVYGSTDLPIPRPFREAVIEDNRLYLKEQERLVQSKRESKTNSSDNGYSSMFRNWKKDDDMDGSPGNYESSFLQGPRVIF